MSKLVRRFALLIAAAALVAAAPVSAFAGESKQTKYWAGLGGATACSVYGLGQSFMAGMGNSYEVFVRPVVGTGQVQARIFFLIPGAPIVFNGGAVAATSQTPALPKPFFNHDSGTVPDGATEAWVTICRTDPEVSHGPAVVTAPVKIEYIEHY